MNDAEHDFSSMRGTRTARRARDRLQPALLDRLTDTAQRRGTEPSYAESIGDERLRSAVLRDLAWLLNTSNAADGIDGVSFPYVLSSVLNYGMRPLAGVQMSGLEPSDVEASIREAILRFEPRIAADSLDVRCIGKGVPGETGESGEASPQNLLAFEIRGRLWSVPRPVDLLLRSELDLETGAMSLQPIQRI
ncbi:MAG TPA: type VI secretion system baseplate subunit TssE [Trinickia sp.]